MTTERITDKEAREKFQELYRVLGNVAEEEFDMRYWCDEVEVENACRTTACAIGHGIIQGLWPKVRLDWEHGEYEYVPNRGGDNNWTATTHMRRSMGLSFSQWDELFIAPSVTFARTCTPSTAEDVREAMQRMAHDKGWGELVD